MKNIRTTNWIVTRLRAILFLMVISRKETLRRELLDKRRVLTEAEVHDLSHGALEIVRGLPQWQTAREVLAYWPVGGELDVRPLIDELWQRGTTVLLPRCRPGILGEMDIACASCKDELAPGPFSIMEPDAAKCPALESYCPDLALIPGVGFDWRGYRLGFGGGYYDRILALDPMQSCLTIGMGFAFQLVDMLPTEEWDMPVNIICTEEELWHP